MKKTGEGERDDLECLGISQPKRISMDYQHFRGDKRLQLCLERVSSVVVQPNVCTSPQDCDCVPPIATHILIDLAFLAHRLGYFGLPVNNFAVNFF